MPMKITLTGLHYFRVVATLGNVSRAADQLNLAQSAVSRQILALEEGLGISLLLRHHRGVELTPAGRHLLDRANLILGTVSDLPHELSALDERPHGTIRIGYPSSMGALIVSPIVIQIAERYEAVDFVLAEGFSAEVIARVEADRLDLGIVSILGGGPDISLTPLFSEDIWLVGVPGQWEFADVVQPLDIERERLVVTSGIRPRLERWANENDVKLSRIIESDSQSTLLALLQGKVARAVVPRSSVHNELERGTLCGAPIRGLFLTRYLAERRDRVRSAISTLFVNLVASRLRELDQARQLVKIKD